jgi:hypothetical protein
MSKSHMKIPGSTPKEGMVLPDRPFETNNDFHDKTLGSTTVQLTLNLNGE